MNMETVLLKLIGLLGALLESPNPWCDYEDMKPLHDEALQILNSDLPDFLAWCKNDYNQGNKIPPEIDDLREIFGRVINKGRYHLNAFADTEREMLEGRPYLWQIADGSKIWLYYIEKYYPQQQPQQGEQAQASQEPSPTEPQLPSELDTDRARKYFARAVKAGYMEMTATEYKWLETQERAQAKLGYLCLKTFEQPRPVTAIEQYFGVKGRLSGAITQASYEPKRADVRKWRAEMDNTIFFD